MAKRAAAPTGATTEIDPGAGDYARQNRLDTWRPMLGTVRPVQDTADSNSGNPWFWARRGHIRRSKVGSLDPSGEWRDHAEVQFGESDPGASFPPSGVGEGPEENHYYRDLEDVSELFPKALCWENKHWSPANDGAEPRSPREPLPIPANADTLGATTPGEIAALKLVRVPRVWFTTWNEQAWQEYDVDGRHVSFPTGISNSYPMGDGAMETQGSALSLQGIMPQPLSSELDVTSGGQPATADYSAYLATGV